MTAWPAAHSSWENEVVSRFPECLIGRLWQNYGALEQFVRLFLCEESKQSLAFPLPLTFNSFIYPDPPTYMTNGDSLGHLIDKYNEIVEKIDPCLCLNPGLVTIRDAMAHGRIIGDSGDNWLLWKPAHGRKPIFHQVFDKKWLRQTSQEISDAVISVMKLALKRGHQYANNNFPPVGKKIEGYWLDFPPIEKQNLITQQPLQQTLLNLLHLSLHGESDNEKFIRGGIISVVRRSCDAIFLEKFELEYLEQWIKRLNISIFCPQSAVSQLTEMLIKAKNNEC